jgi:hypothetical protein
MARARSQTADQAGKFPVWACQKPIPEMIAARALAAKTAKIALGELLSDAVRLGLMAERDAQRTGRMILHDNAARLYGLPS